MRLIRDWLSLPLAFVICGWLGFHATAAQSFQRPEVWMNHYRIGDLTQTNQWSFVRSRLDTAILYINTLWPKVNPNVRITAEQAAASAAVLTEAKINIAVEGGYFDRDAVFANPGNPESAIEQIVARTAIEPGIGQATALIERNKLKPLWASGRPPDFMILDDPMRRLTVPGQDVPGTHAEGMEDYRAAAREVVEYMNTMRETMPQLQFVIIFNFPNWGWKGEPAFNRSPGIYSPMNWGDAHTALTTLLDVLKENNLTPFAVQADHPWRYYAEPPTDALAAGVDWPERVRELERVVKSRGIRFHLVTNSETGYVSAQRFSEDSLHYLDTYLANGGRPDAVVVQSWYPHPEQLLPETEPYTTAWLTKEFAERLSAIERGEEPVAVQPFEYRPLNRAEPEAWQHLFDYHAQLDPDANAERVIAKRLENEWLNRFDEPDTAMAVDLLREALSMVDKLRMDLPSVRVKWNRDGLTASHLCPVPNVRSGLLIELFNLTDESRQATAWQDGFTGTRMQPVWVPPFSSRFLIAGIEQPPVIEGELRFRIGNPEAPEFEALSFTVPSSIILTPANEE